ncbi:unnamed protein product [Psylliodes chrysocephalus]|uniref:Mutator-like transposase domain-containing protein n=1 Tax=Psylliodes chrysocephalus TaxID=3402493 RepID=A0A9P0DB28_9CUCU|nr:unnamed protein product [Psylliodes chrysocephala]
MVCAGDSSCFKSILDSNPYYEYNIQVKKLECKNHLLRNYINNIREPNNIKEAAEEKRVRKQKNIYYGPNCQKPDLDTVSFEAARNNFLESLHLSQFETKNMERLTRNQANNDMWINERKRE